MSAAHRAWAIDASRAEARVALGSVLCYTGQLEEGMSELKRAIFLNPGLSLAHNRLGMALYVTERHAEAISAMNTSDAAILTRALGGNVKQAGTMGAPSSAAPVVSSGGPMSSLPGFGTDTGTGGTTRLPAGTTGDL